MAIAHRKPFWRGFNFLNLNFILHQPIEEILYKHSQRSNSIRIFGVMLAGFYIGTLFFYLKYKLAHERKNVESYGQDLPYQIKFSY